MSIVIKSLVTLLALAVCIAAALLRHLWWPPLVSWVHINNDGLKGFAGLITILLFLSSLVGLLIGVWKPKKRQHGSRSQGDQSAHVDVSGSLTNSPTTTHVYNAPVAISAIEPKANIEQEIDYRTNQVITHTRLTITGLATTFPRDERKRIEDQLRLGRSIALTGNAGSGKSGIGVMTATEGRTKGRLVLLLDARRLKHIRHERDLRVDFGVNDPLTAVIGRIANNRGFRLVIDQLDNVIGLPISNVLVELAIECSNLTGVEVVVICRKRETHESQLLERFFSAGFFELESRELDTIAAESALRALGINPSDDLISRCRNLLNLEIVATIKARRPDFDFLAVMGEVEIWNAYLDVLRQREEDGSTLAESELTMREAVRLATEGLRTGEQIFLLDEPLSPYHRRLISWEMIVREDGRYHRFKHEKLQDFLYARDASDRGLMPPAVMAEINLVRSRNILLWMNKIYADRKSGRRLEFARAMLSTQD